MNNSCTVNVWNHSFPHQLHLVNSSIQALSPYSVWTVRTSFNLMTKLLAMVFNTILVYLFIRFKSVRTAFNVYILNLCSANMVYLWIFYPTTMANDWVVFDSPPPALCIFIRYMSKTFGGLIANSHFLIAVNRLWAIARPISYRNYHRSNSVLRPIVVCVLMWLYVHACSVPMIIIDALQPRSPPEGFHCSLSALGPRGWTVTNQIVVYDLPMVLAFLIYPYICYRNFMNSKFKRGKVAIAAKNKEAGGEGGGGGGAKVKVELANEENIDSAKACWGFLKTRNVRNGSGLLMLSWLTLNVAVSLFPSAVYFTLVSLGYHLPGMYATVTILYSLACLLDPLLFLSTVQTLRDAMKNLVPFCRK